MLPVTSGSWKPRKMELVRNLSWVCLDRAYHVFDLVDDLGVAVVGRAAGVVHVLGVLEDVLARGTKGIVRHGLPALRNQVAPHQLLLRLELIEQPLDLLFLVLDPDLGELGLARDLPPVG